MARTRGIPSYNIAKNQQLLDITRLRPVSRTERLTVAGIGEEKAAEYGNAILKVLATHASEGAKNVG